MTIRARCRPNCPDRKVGQSNFTARAPPGSRVQSRYNSKLSVSRAGNPDQPQSQIRAPSYSQSIQTSGKSAFRRRRFPLPGTDAFGTTSSTPRTAKIFSLGNAKLGLENSASPIEKPLSRQLCRGSARFGSKRLGYYRAADAKQVAIRRRRLMAGVSGWHPRDRSTQRRLERATGHGFRIPAWGIRQTAALGGGHESGVALHTRHRFSDTG